MHRRSRTHTQVTLVTYLIKSYHSLMGHTHNKMRNYGIYTDTQIRTCTHAVMTVDVHM